ncbi:hypothetical protein LOTGIDRAFT_237561 [Lottia gigantea]|uniref:Cilia- and flagella-associated protein 46 n=1 Tax=Lottia gigantea TaxID=225164 RepID=V4CMX4_LOTGI|nr:hypothetical protein LOTGIDRAFT_237561 [Lottia gigantea]ESP03735.1 hypothetical protein LOTGIDRAFT_237561 [Lottia gigantea]
MDSSIRSLICTAKSQAGANQIHALEQAYKILRTVAENRPAIDETEAFNSDLYVLCAETAYQYGLTDMTRECLKMFFMKPPPANQFLCRAYLCQAQLIAPHDANNWAQLEKAVVYIVKAITIAKTNQRYHFIVYNASVIYWQFCRPFLKPGYRQYLATSLHQIVKALDDIDDQDFEWRAQLMIGLIECHLDAGRRSDASHIATAAATFIKQNVPAMFKQVFGLMVHNQLVETSKLHKDIKNSPELSVYYKICKIKLSLEMKEQKDYYTEIQGILNQMGLTVSQTLSQTTVSDRISRKDSKMATGRDSSTNVSLSQPGKDEETTPTKRSGSKTGRRTPTPTSSKRFPGDCSDKPYLLLELGRLCLELDLPELAESCVDSIKQSNIKDPKFFLELEFLDCEMMVKVLGEKQESYQKVSVDTRLLSMKRCEEAIMNSKRQGDPNIVQVGCVTQWNLSLPLQQPNLRHHIRKHLTVIAEALEEINSLLVQLRCQIHTELSHCEEDSEQIQVAMQHIKKALSLDDGEVYRERLEVALHRLELRSELYQQPERAEDLAAMIIEQARNCDSGTIRMKRSLLVKAGEALSPDAFLLVLDSESETRDIASGKGPQTMITKLACKAQQFNKCVKKVEGHIKRLGNENDRERARLWADLAKTARKHEVWDVCRVAARFTLLYDDDRWKSVSEDRLSLIIEAQYLTKQHFQRVHMANTYYLVFSPVTVSREKESREDGATSEIEKKSTSRIGSRPTTPDQSLPLYNKDLLRILAEVNFILGEAYIHLLRSEKVELNNVPIPPEDTRKRPKGYVAKKPEEDPDWLEYCDWIKMLSEMSTKSFLRGLELGVVLDEAWLVCSAAAYIWNYNNHVLAGNRHREILDTLSAVLDGLRQVGHAGETVMLVNICNALAYSLILPWIPAPAPKEVQEPPTSPSPDEKGKDKKPVRATVGTAKSKGGVTVTICSEAQPDLKKAIEVCEYGIQVTNGDNTRDIVPISIRLPLLQTWVCVKQMALQQIPKTLGTDDETNMEGQRGMTKAIVATEMSALSKNGIMEFKDGINLTEITQLVENCRWTEKFIELQLWSKLTFLSFDQKQHSLVLKCSEKALRFAVVGTQPKNRKMDPHRAMVEQEMLSYTSCILGQSLMVNMAGKNSIRRQAMEAFLNSARYARNAKNYGLVMSAARHYWNACVPLLNQPIERELIKEPVRVLLQCITATADSPKKEDKEEKTGQGEGIVNIKGDNKEEEKSSRLVGGIDDDLSLRAALYGLLFQAYADRGEWEESMVAMDQAITDMPRTKHRLLIFKHRVMVKARLGQDVQMDIQKFKDESEDYVAHMWRRVALSSKVTAEQLSSYQNAIEALTSVESNWLKIDYLLEFSQWLYVNQFPIEDSIDQVEWAVDILLNMKFESPLKKDALSDSTNNLSKDNKKEKKKGRMSAKKPKTPELEKPVIETVDIKSEKAESEKEIKAEDYVPVVKQADIGHTLFFVLDICVGPVFLCILGVLPRDMNLTIEDLTDIQQLDYLFRAHVILAQIHGRGSPCYKDTLLTAYSYLQRIWQVSITASGPTLKELAKVPVTETAMSGKNSAKSKGKKDKEKEVVKEKPKRKGPLDVLPVSTEEWANYDVPDEVLEAFKHEAMNKHGVNTHTLTKPLLTSHYLEELTEELRALGYNHLSLPVLAFQDLMARGIFNNKAMSNLYHIKSLEVCYELDIKTGCLFHEKAVGNMEISEEEQARSRDEIAIWKEKQVQVAREELRVKESLVRLATEGKIEKRSLTSKTMNSPNKEEKLETVQHLGKVLGAVSMREIWTLTAEVLIRQGYNQHAREYLHEANLAAQAFGDKKLESGILYILGQLAFNEAQYGQCFNLCRSAQNLQCGDEMFWFKSTMLIIEATLKDYENKNNKRVARKIVLHAMKEFNQIYEERPNRLSSICFILSSFEAKLATIQSTILMEGGRKSTVPKVMKGLLSACEKFENSIEKLLGLGYRREALPFIKQHADVLKHIAREAIEPEIKHTYLLQSLAVLKEGVAITEDLFADSLSLATLQDSRSMNSPLQRELVEIQIKCGELLIDILKLQSQEVRVQQLNDERKGSVLLLVEDYIRETPKYTHMEKDWVEIKQSVGEEAMLLLINSHSLAGNIIPLRTQSLLSIGKCLHLLGQSLHPNPPSQWLNKHMEMLKGSSELGENQDVESEKLIEETKQTIKYSYQIKQKQKLYESSRSYLLQACECLLQALNLSLNHHLFKLASSASLEMVELMGQFDPMAASQFLALHQSCETSVNLGSLLQRAQLDPVTSKLSALLHQRNNILDSDIQTNLSSSTIMSSVNSALEKDWQAWKRLDVVSNHLELLKEFPPNFNFIVLQHSPDRSFLYGAILDKPKHSSTGAGGKGGKHHSSSVPSRAKIFGVETSPKILEELVERFRFHKQSVQQLQLKQEYQRTQAALRNKMLKNIDNSIKQEAKVQTAEDQLEEQRLAEEFQQLVIAMETYLKPVINPLHNALRSTSSPTGSMANLAKEPKDHVVSPECIILLADPVLLEMPLEALECLQSESVSSLSRDFSLQMFSHRFHQEALAGEDPNTDKHKKKAKDAGQPMSRIPGAREAKQKQAKLVPLDRPIQPWQFPVDTMNFRCILYHIDKALVNMRVLGGACMSCLFDHCYDDCAETEENKPVTLFNHLLTEYEQQFTPRWLGLTGDDHSPSVGEWEVYLKESSSFIFYGMERLLSYIPPSKLAALNIPDCVMLFCLDMTQTNKSFLRQSKIDILKSHNDLSLEKPVESAMLSSLSGIRCLLANQWPCTLAENSHKLTLAFKDLLEKGKTTGQSVRLMMSPQKRANETRAEEEAKELEAASSPAGKGKDADKHDDKHPKGTTGTPDVGLESEKVPEVPPESESQIKSSWFNLVCYGLPNVVITQM